MAQHFLRDLEYLKKELLLLGSMVEEATQKAIVALLDRRKELAEAVIRGDREIDDREVRLEDDCLKVLALHQPVANDLRFVVTVLKVLNDLERVGDLARNIAERGRALADADVVVPAEIRAMADSVRSMFRDVLSAVVESDTALAQQVLERDAGVDQIHQRIFELIEERILEKPESVRIQIQLLSVSRYMERIADYATNIAEDVVFMVDGEVIRHQGH